MIDRSRDATASVAIATRGLLLDQSPYRRPFSDSETRRRARRASVVVVHPNGIEPRSMAWPAESISSVAVARIRRAAHGGDAS